jgi:4-amino-4-deoxy-L-arabinose transferase-like glycosyltransferase
MSVLDRVRASTPHALVLVLGVALAARLAVMPASTEQTMDPDGAHLMNVARCIERGQGFSNPAAWPAWMKPERLPMPETFKEPAYPYAVAALAPLTGGEFRAGQLVALLSGLLLVIATFALASNLGLGRGVSTLAALLVAINPLSVFMSVRVMVDAMFPALLTTAFALAAWRPHGMIRPPWLDVLTGVATGLAFMTRGQALVAIPALALLVVRPFHPRAMRSLSFTLIPAILTASPFLLRNLRLFGVPFYSDVGAYGLWPYVDHLTFSHGLDRPPAPLAFALTHLPLVVRHMAESAVRFAVSYLPQEVGGHPVWMIPLAIGAVLVIRQWRTFLAPLFYLVVTVAFIFAVNWDGRYFSSTVPLLSIATAIGAAWIAAALGPLELWGRLRGVHVLIAALVVTSALQVAVARRELKQPSPENQAARSEAAFLRAHLEPDESVMVVTTSFWSWFTDRPSVHLVIADDARFAEVVRRLKVRWAALPTSRIPQFAARYPGGRLPAALVVHHVDPLRDVTVFEVRPGGAGPVTP